MILGIGLDLVEISRMARALERSGERFVRRVFTAAERSDCEGRADAAQAFAARFAAKEACLKAFGTGWGEGLAFRQVEVLRGEGGRPRLRLHGAAADRAHALGVRHLHVTLTHQPAVAAAMVVLEG